MIPPAGPRPARPASYVDQCRIVMGSARALARQLGDLNGVTWKAVDSQIARWSRRPPLDDAALEAKARHAFAVLLGLAQRAVDQRLPMKLDY